MGLASLRYPSLILVAGTMIGTAPAFAVNLVQNGDFENSSSINNPTYSPGNTGGVGQINQAVSLPNWTLTCLLNCAASKGFAFIANADADNKPNGGFPSVYYPTEGNMYLWGPDYSPDPQSNGFSTSSNGGKFLAIDGDFGQSKLSQTISGLDTTKTYTLSFEYAGAQQARYTGDTTQKWIVGGLGAAIDVGPWTNPSKGFTAWDTYTTSFTPTSSTINLSFTAWGAVVGGTPGGQGPGIESLPPFLLLDNVQLLEQPPSTPPNPPTTPSAAPGPLPVLGAGLAISLSRSLRRRLKTST